MVINAELKPGEYVIARGLSVINSREDDEIECESIQASSYHHYTVPQIKEAVTSLRPGFLVAKICDVSNAQPV